MARMFRALAVGGAVTLLMLAVAAAPAGAQTTTRTINLNNATAPAGGAGDCPATGGPYWHFILAPNNNTKDFTSITLNLRGDLVVFPNDQILPNGRQVDNVFVKVPAGYALTDLRTQGSVATYTGPQANNFNLSHICPSYTGSGVLGETLTSVDPATGNAVVSGTEGEVQVAGAVATSGALPYTGSGSSVPLAQIGVALLAVGAVITFGMRKRTTSRSGVRS